MDERGCLRVVRTGDSLVMGSLSVPARPTHCDPSAYPLSPRPPTLEDPPSVADQREPTPALHVRFATRVGTDREDAMLARVSP